MKGEGWCHEEVVVPQRGVHVATPNLITGRLQRALSS